MRVKLSKCIGLVCMSMACNLVAQDTVLHLRVLNGRNGRPMENTIVQVWYDEQMGAPITLRADAQGAVTVPPPLSPAERLLYSISGDALDCRKAETPPTAYLLSRIEKSGETSDNQCGSPVIHLEPGELVVFVRDRRWYDNNR